MASKTDDPVKQLTEEQIAEFKEVRAARSRRGIFYRVLFYKRNHHGNARDPLKMTVW